MAQRVPIGALPRLGVVSPFITAVLAERDRRGTSQDDRDLLWPAAAAPPAPDVPASFIQHDPGDDQ